MSARTSYTAVTAAQITDATAIGRQLITLDSAVTGPVTLNAGTVQVIAGITTMGVVSPVTSAGAQNGVLTDLG